MKTALWANFGRRGLCLGIAGLATLPFGCHRSVNMVENTDVAYEQHFLRNRRIETDKGLAGRLEVVRIDDQALDTGLMKVQVTVRNKRRSDFKYAYRFTWFDEAGMEVATSASSWIEKDIYGGDTQYLSAIAPNPRCQDFLVRFRELD
jgi:uncharacterized protein YcfL